MSNNQWSEDEDNDIKEQPERIFPPSDSESEEDYDYSKINNSKSLFENEEYLLKNQFKKNNENKVRIKKQKNKKTINWYDNEVSNEPEKKKWISNRMLNKKKRDGKIVTELKRKFNPRLPIPNNKTKINDSKKKYDILKLRNEKDFPNL